VAGSSGRDAPDAQVHILHFDDWYSLALERMDLLRFVTALEMAFLH
jgi:hypothetical protein